MKIRDERSELEAIINSSPEKIGNEVIDASELKMDPTFTLDFDELQKICDRKAKKLIYTVTGFMLSDELVRENPYFKNKMQVDVISLAGMLYQLEVNKTMQTTLMEEVRSGATHPRMFEVFGQLSKTIGELNKQLLQTVEAIKMTYRDLKDDVREKNQNAALGEGNLQRNDKGIIALGTKELIRETKKLKMAQQNIEDVEVTNNNAD